MCLIHLPRVLVPTSQSCINKQTKPIYGFVVTFVDTGGGTGTFKTVNLATNIIRNNIKIIINSVTNSQRYNSCI